MWSEGNEIERQLLINMRLYLLNTFAFFQK